MTGPLATSNRARDRWPNEPKESYEPVERDRDGLFSDLDFSLVLALLLRRGLLTHDEAVDVAREILTALTGRR